MELIYKKYQYILLTFTAILVLGGTFEILYKFSMNTLNDKVFNTIYSEKMDDIIKLKYENITIPTISTNDNKINKQQKYLKYYNTNTTTDDVKYNIHSMIKHKPNIQKDEKIKIHNTNNTLPSVTGIFCTYDTSKVLESYEGNKIICPVGFSIEIEDVFFGRRVNDNKKCIKDENGNDYPENWITVSEEEKCELKPLDKVKKLCDDNRSCYIKPSTIIYGTPCSERSLYMDVTYHCKPKEIQEPKFEIIMFADKVKKDSVYENAISEFAQYADAYNYGFSLEDQNIIKTRSIYYMKLYYILEHLMDAMKNQSYDWLFWVDGDVVLTNPNIQLKAFIPPDDKDDIHLVIANDENGLNAGIFLIRVHPWSIDFMMKAYTYAFYHSEASLFYYDQSSMFHVLQNMEEDSHYIIVPQNWFNSYCCDVKFVGNIIEGDFLVHLAGIISKDDFAKSIRETIYNDESWFSKTNSEMRKEALKYYNLPKDEQIKL